MLVEQVTTYLEMTAPDQLRPGRLPAEAVGLEPVAHDAEVLRRTHDRVGAPHHWSSVGWSASRWREHAGQRGMRHWVVRVDGDVAGVLSAQAQPQGDVEIDVFGLVPEHVGRGHGGHALTLAVRQAWRLEAIGAERVRRVWLHTSSLDHPHALGNYRSRGFRPFRTERRRKEVPG